MEVIVITLSILLLIFIGLLLFAVLVAVAAIGKILRIVSAIFSPILNIFKPW